MLVSITMWLWGTVGGCTSSPCKHGPLSLLLLLRPISRFSWCWLEPEPSVTAKWEWRHPTSVSVSSFFPVRPNLQQLLQNCRTAELWTLHTTWYSIVISPLFFSFLHLSVPSVICYNIIELELTSIKAILVTKERLPKKIDAYL